MHQKGLTLLFLNMWTGCEQVPKPKTKLKAFSWFSRGTRDYTLLPHGGHTDSSTYKHLFLHTAQLQKMLKPHLPFYKCACRMIPKTKESIIHSWFSESIISSSLIAEIDDRVKLKPVESSLTEFNSAESHKAQQYFSDTCLRLQAIIKNYNKLQIF